MIMKAGIATVARLDPIQPDTNGSTPLPAAPLMLEYPSEPKKYQRCGSVCIRPLILPGNAFEVARENYSKYARLNFEQDLLHYLSCGFVVSNPRVFAMGRPIEHGGRYGWFIQMAVGNILELLNQLPFKLDFVAFCRDNDDNMRVVDMDYFINKVVKRKVA